MASRVKNWVEANRGLIEETYHQLHEIAEVSWKEINTTRYLSDWLQRIGVEYQTFEDQTGVVAVWNGESAGPTVALRADIDALWQNVDGTWKANHSCGHDAHMTMVLHSLNCLKHIGFSPKGKLKIIFQPAEETGCGAKSLVEKGIVDDVDALLGIHVRPIQELSFATASPAIYHGSVAQLRGKLTGLQAHAARPNLGINTIDSLAAIINAVNAVKVDPTISASAKVTNVRAGGSSLNIIPDEAEFGIDLRAQTNETMDELLNKVTNAVHHAGSTNGATVELELLSRSHAAIPHPAMERMVHQAIAQVLGEKAVYPPPLTPGGEDFHFYSASNPRIAATMVALGTGLKPGLHHPQMEFNLASLSYGISILAVSVMNMFEEFISEKNSRKGSC